MGIALIACAQLMRTNIPIGQVGGAFVDACRAFDVNFFDALYFFIFYSLIKDVDYFWVFYR